MKVKHGAYMTMRLENAIKRLAPQDIEQVTRFAEQLANHEANSKPQKYLKLDWIGSAEGAYPEYQTGVDAAQAAMDMMRHGAEDGLAK
jgi:hypothetical protein